MASSSTTQPSGTFHYSRARTTEEAVTEVARGARVIAGGTVLVPEISRESLEGYFVDIAGIKTLDTISVNSEGAAIGALTSIDELCQHPGLARYYTALWQAAGRIGNPHVRRSGTIGGNLVWGLPRACLPPALLVLDAEVNLCSVSGFSVQPISRFMSDGLPERTLLLNVHLPPPKKGSHSGYLKYAWRHATAMALVIVAVASARDDRGALFEPRLAVGGLCRARRLPAAEGMLAGRRLDRDLIDRVARTAAAEPPFEETGTASGEGYRRRQVESGVRQLLSEMLGPTHE